MRSIPSTKPVAIPQTWAVDAIEQHKIALDQGFIPDVPSPTTRVALEGDSGKA